MEADTQEGLTVSYRLELPGSSTARLTVPALLGQCCWYRAGNGGGRDRGLREAREKELVHPEPLGEVRS